MSYLVLAYFHNVEGKSDWPFLEPVCRRLLESVLSEATAPVEIQRSLLPLGSGARDVESQRALAVDQSGEFHIAFLHADDANLGLPRSAGDIEVLADPKSRLDAVCARARGRRRRRGQSGPPGALLGEKIALSALRRLTALRSFEAELRRALQALRFLPGPR